MVEILSKSKGDYSCKKKGLLDKEIDITFEWTGIFGSGFQQSDSLFVFYHCIKN
ncbi:MAG: hypothetical protein AB2693_22145 [Candidatus Thiodiazotropha sp.]